MCTINDPPNHKKDAVETYKELTKLIITLSTGIFVLLPAILSLIGPKAIKILPALFVSWTLLFISILLGLLVLSSLAGTQNSNQYQINNRFTKWFSRFQWIVFLLGIAVSGFFVGSNLAYQKQYDKYQILYGYVKADIALVRKTASTKKNNIIDEIRKCERLALKIMEEQNGWLHIVYSRRSETEKRGWVLKEEIVVLTLGKSNRVVDKPTRRDNKL